MRLHKRGLIAIGGSAAALLLVLAIPARERAETPTPAFPQDSRRGDQTASLDKTAGELLSRQRERSAQLAWGRDPFHRPSPVVAGSPPQQPVVAHEDTARPKLTGVSASGGDRWAIIDRRIVRAGDRLPSGHTVASIDNRTVTLLLGEEQLVLSLGDDR